MRSMEVSLGREPWLKVNTGGRLELVEGGKLRSFSTIVLSVDLLSRRLQDQISGEYHELDAVLRSCRWPCLGRREIERSGTETQIEVTLATRPRRA